MKNKIYSVLLVTAMSLSLIACGNNATDEVPSNIEAEVVEDITLDVSDVEVVEDSDVEDSDDNAEESNNLDVAEETVETVSNIELPIAYEEILENCRNIINKAETEHTADLEEEGELMGFTDFVLHAGISMEDFCYACTDLNGDGIMELILAGRCTDVSGGSINYKAGYTLINIFTLEEDAAISLVDANLINSWYLNADGELVNEQQVNPSWYEICVYSFEEGATELTENYCLYNTYLDNNTDVGSYEKIDGGDEVLINQYEDFNSDELWTDYMEVLNQYTENLYELDLISICEE